MISSKSTARKWPEQASTVNRLQPAVLPFFDAADNTASESAQKMAIKRDGETVSIAMEGIYRQK